MVALKNKAKNIEADILIIGGGAAGMSAAVSAAEHGAGKVIVLEKRRLAGGNASRAATIFAAESTAQKRAMIYASKDELFKKAMNWHRWDKVDPKIVRTYINESSGTIEWLEEKGIEFDVGTLCRLNPDHLPTWHIPKGLVGKVIKVLNGYCIEMGVQLLFRNRCKKILLAADGKVAGVLVINPEGEEFEIKSKSVIITTGGFAGNKKLLKKYFNFYDENIPNIGIPNQGDGLVMAEEAGAYIENFATMLKEGPLVKNSFLLMNLVREPYMLWINKKGKRFIDEVTGYDPFKSGNSILRQPDKISYAIFDDSIRKKMEETGIILTRKMLPGREIPGLKKELRRLADRHDIVKVSDSWEEISHWIGSESKTLKSTVDEYNTFCERGYDKAFVKERRHLIPLTHPPYYAIKCQVCVLDTIGGIRINEDMEVLDKGENSIPGLYAAGVAAGGWQSEHYCSELSGSAIGFSMTSGRIAAKNAAKYALKK